MNVLINVSLVVLLLAALLGSMAEMRDALDEIDIDRFYIWTCVASIIAGLPIMLW